MLFPQNVGSKDFGHEKGSKASEGAATGGGSGAVLGGALGWLVGIGALAIPGIGPSVAAGPILVALAGMGVGAAAGGILLSVHSDSPDWTKRAKDILERTGAQDVSSSAEARADHARSDRPASRTPGDVEAVQIRGEGKSVSVDRPAGPRDHATTFGVGSRQSAASGLAAGEVTKTPSH